MAVVDSHYSFVIEYETQYGTAPAAVNRTTNGNYDFSYTFTAEDLPTLSVNEATHMSWNLNGTPLYEGSVVEISEKGQVLTLTAVWQENRTLKTRIVHKHDKAENWEKATNFTPKNGELIVYEMDEEYAYTRLKIGNGTDNVNDLPFETIALTSDEIDEIYDALEVGE